MNGLRMGHRGRPELAQIVPVVLPHFPKCVVGAVGTIAMARGLRVQEGLARFFPRAVFTDFFTYTTLNYHIVPAFLHRIHADERGALTVPTVRIDDAVDLNPCCYIHYVADLPEGGVKCSKKELVRRHFLPGSVALLCRAGRLLLSIQCVSLANCALCAVFRTDRFLAE